MGKEALAGCILAIKQTHEDIPPESHPGTAVALSVAFGTLMQGACFVEGLPGEFFYSAVAVFQTDGHLGSKFYG